MNPRNLGSLHMHGMFLLVALVVQYALGMYVDLFVTFPENSTDGQLWEFAWSQMPLAAHIILAFIVLFGAIVLCVRAIRYKNRKWIIASSVGLVAVLAAGASGARFIPSQTNAYSYFMALAFLVAVLSYAWGLFSSEQPESTPQSI